MNSFVARWGLLKNPLSQRFVEYGAPQEVAETLFFNSLLMRMIDKATLVPKPGSGTSV